MSSSWKIPTANTPRSNLQEHTKIENLVKNNNQSKFEFSKQEAFNAFAVCHDAVHHITRHVAGRSPAPQTRLNFQAGSTIQRTRRLHPVLKSAGILSRTYPVIVQGPASGARLVPARPGARCMGRPPCITHHHDWELARGPAQHRHQVRGAVGLASNRRRWRWSQRLSQAAPSACTLQRALASGVARKPPRQTCQPLAVSPCCCWLEPLLLNPRLAPWGRLQCAMRTLHALSLPAVSVRPCS